MKTYDLMLDNFGQRMLQACYRLLVHRQKTIQRRIISLLSTRSINKLVLPVKMVKKIGHF